MLKDVGIKDEQVKSFIILKKTKINRPKWKHSDHFLLGQTLLAMSLKDLESYLMLSDIKSK